MKNIVFVGNPNSGKSTLFNNITKANAHTGNFHGVTVDSEMADIGERCFIDLPGIYSLTAFSNEEQVSIDYIQSHTGDIFVVVCDAYFFQRSMYLINELIEKNVNFVIFLNHYNKFRMQNNFINIKEIGSKLNRKIMVGDATTINSTYFINFILNADKMIMQDAKNNKQNNSLLENELKIKNTEYTQQTKNLKTDNSPNNDANFKTINEKKANIKKSENLNNITFDKMTNCKNKNEKIANHYKKIKSNLTNNYIVKDNKITKADKIILNKYLFFPLFILAMFAILYLIFYVVSPMFTNFLNAIIDLLIFNPFICLIDKFVNNDILYSLLTDGILAAVAGVLEFLVPIMLLAMTLKFLEDSGVMSRICFMLDDYLRAFGLNGKAVYTMMMGLGCNTSAIALSQNLSNENMQKKCAIVLPFVSCSAKLPIYSMLAMSFFSSFSIFVIFGLYLLSITISLLFAFLLEKTILKSGDDRFFIEFPHYRLPKIKPLLLAGWNAGKSFVIKIATVIVGVSILVWLLLNFDFSFNYQSDSNMLEMIAGILSPIFSPIGLNNTTIITALIVGIMAKELILSTIVVSGVLSIGAASAMSLLVFVSLYIPCISSLKAIKEYAGKKYIFISIIFHFCIAYLFSFFVYNIYLFNFNWFLILLLTGAIFLILLSLKNILKCKNCHQCKK